MALVSHIFLVILFILVSLNRTGAYHRITNTFMITFGVFLFLFFVNFSRSGGDIHAYQTGFSGNMYPIYILRELIFWETGRSLYRLFGSYDFTFFIFDCLMLFFILLSSRIVQDKSGFILLYICSYPALFFHENTIRQGIATCFIIFLFAIFITKRRNTLLGILSTASVFIHNFSATYIPFLLIRINFIRKFFAFILFLSICIFFVGASTRNSIKSGLPLDIVFHLYFIGLMVISLFINLHRKRDYHSFITFRLILFMVVVGFIIGDSQYERLSFSILLILQFLIVTNTSIKRKTNHRLLNTFNAGVLIFPKFIAGSTLNLMMN